MKPEISFLLDLLFDHCLEEQTCTLIKDRVRALEEAILSQGAPKPVAARPSFIGAQVATKGEAPVPPPVDIAQTPAAAQALASRQQAIQESIAGKIDKQLGRPRKF